MKIQIKRSKWITGNLCDGKGMCVLGYILNKKFRMSKKAMKANQELGYKVLEDRGIDSTDYWSINDKKDSIHGKFTESELIERAKQDNIELEFVD